MSTKGLTSEDLISGLNNGLRGEAPLVTAPTSDVTPVNPKGLKLSESRSIFFPDPLTTGDMFKGEIVPRVFTGKSSPQAPENKFDTPKKPTYIEQVQQAAQNAVITRDTELLKVLRNSPEGNLSLDDLKSFVTTGQDGGDTSQSSSTRSRNATNTAAAVKKISTNEALKTQFRELSSETFNMKDGSNLNTLWEQSVQNAIAEEQKFAEAYGSGEMVAFVKAFTGQDVTPQLRAGYDSALRKLEIVGNAVQVRWQTSKNLTDLIDKIRTDETLSDIDALTTGKADKKQAAEIRKNVATGIVKAYNDGNLPGWNISSDNIGNLVDTFVQFLSTGGRPDDPMWGQAGASVLASIKGIDPIRQANPTSLASTWSNLIQTTSPNGRTNRDALIALQRTTDDYLKHLNKTGAKTAVIEEFKTNLNSSVPEQRAAALKALDTFAYEQQKEIFTIGLNSQIAKGSIPLKSPNLVYSKLTQEGEIEPDAAMGNIIQSRQVADGREVPEYLESVLERLRLTVQGGGEQQVDQATKEALAAKYANTISKLSREMLKGSNIPEFLPAYLNLSGDSFLLRIKGGGAYGYDRKIPMDFTNPAALKHFLLQSTVF